MYPSSGRGKSEERLFQTHLVTMCHSLFFLILYCYVKTRSRTSKEMFYLYCVILTFSLLCFFSILVVLVFITLFSLPKFTAKRRYVSVQVVFFFPSLLWQSIGKATIKLRTTGQGVALNCAEQHSLKII